MQVCQAHNESVFVWKSIVVSAVSEHGSAIFVSVTYVLEVVTNTVEHCVKILARSRNLGSVRDWSRDLVFG